MAYEYPSLNYGSIWKPPYQYQEPNQMPGITGGFAVSGLGQSYSLMQNAAMRGTPAYPSAPKLEQGPETGFYEYTPGSPIQRIQAPDYRLMQGEGAIQSGYQGLMGGDYARLEQALYDPAAAAAERAYKQSLADLENRMSAQGLYGGSEFARLATEGVGRTYQETLANAAAQATAQRYGLQSQEQIEAERLRQSAMQMGLMREQGYNQFMLNQAGQQMGQEQNIWQAGMTEAQRVQAYNQAMWQQNAAAAQGAVDFRNQQAMMEYQNAIAARAAGLAGEEQMFNQGLALAGMGAPMTSASLQYQAALAQAQAQREAAAKASGAATWGALAGAGGQVAGGLLGNKDFTNWLSNLNWGNTGAGASIGSTWAEYPTGPMSGQPYDYGMQSYY